MECSNTVIGTSYSNILHTYSKKHAYLNFDFALINFRLCEYLLACPSPEVRVVFMKLVVFLAHFAIQDPPGESYSF